MQKATATYVAPFGDSKVLEWDGVTFLDGKPVELNSFDNPHIMTKIANHPHFDVKMGKEEDEPIPAAKKRGRPSHADLNAAKEAAAKADEDAKSAAAKAKDTK